MGKQERRAKREKKADEQAKVIVGTAIHEAVERYNQDRQEGVTDDEFSLGSRVRELRDQGEPWWAIADQLGLPGAGKSATTGKKGAARARNAYKKAFGSFPRTFHKGQGKTSREKNEHVKELRAKKRTERRKAIERGEPVLDLSLSEAELEEMLKGRKITWMVTAFEANMDMNAIVHPKACRVMEEGGRLVVHFREIEDSKLKDHRAMMGRYRTVVLANIHSVRS